MRGAGPGAGVQGRRPVPCRMPLKAGYHSAAWLCLGTLCPGSVWAGEQAHKPQVPGGLSCLPSPTRTCCKHRASHTASGLGAKTAAGHGQCKSPSVTWHGAGHRLALVVGRAWGWLRSERAGGTEDLGPGWQRAEQQAVAQVTWGAAGGPGCGTLPGLVGVLECGVQLLEALLERVALIVLHQLLRAQCSARSGCPTPCSSPSPGWRQCLDLGPATAPANFLEE